MEKPTRPEAARGRMRGRDWLRALARFLPRWLAAVLIASTLIWKNPFKLTDVTERYSVEVFHQLAAPFYPHGADRLLRDQITVLLIQEETLSQTLQTEWPIAYGQHARILRQILKHQPAAVFVDILFRTQRAGDSTAEALGAEIDHYRDAGVPLLFAADGVDSPEQRATRAGLLHNADLAAVTWTPLRGVPFGYPRCPLPDDCTLQTPAFAIYDRLCARDPRSPFCPPDRALDSGLIGDAVRLDSQPMHVDWGIRAAAINRTQASPRCWPEPFGWSDVLGRAARRVMGGSEDFYVDCPYHAVLPVDRVLYPSSFGYDAVDALIRNRIVFIGAVLVGIPDVAITPTHGRVPGVYLHAMALDNLLTYGRLYKGHWRPPTPYDAYGIGTDETAAIVLVAIFTSVFMWADSYGKQRALMWIRRFPRADEPHVRAVVERFWFALCGLALIVATLTALLLAYAWWGLAPIDWMGAVLAAAVAKEAVLDWLPSLGQQARLALAILTGRGRRPAAPVHPTPATEGDRDDALSAHH